MTSPLFQMVYDLRGFYTQQHVEISKLYHPGWLDGLSFRLSTRERGISKGPSTRKSSKGGPHSADLDRERIIF